MDIFIKKEQRSISEMLTHLHIPEPLHKGIIKSYGQLVQPGQEHDGRFQATMAALLLLLSFERQDAEQMPEYMRMRAVTQHTYYQALCPKGYAETFGGEPEFYGLINALVIKLLDVVKNIPKA